MWILRQLCTEPGYPGAGLYGGYRFDRDIYRTTNPRGWFRRYIPATANITREELKRIELTGLPDIGELEDVDIEELY